MLFHYKKWLIIYCRVTGTYTAMGYGFKSTPAPSMKHAQNYIEIMTYLVETKGVTGNAYEY